MRVIFEGATKGNGGGGEGHRGCGGGQRSESTTSWVKLAHIFFGSFLDEAKKALETSKMAIWTKCYQN